MLAGLRESQEGHSQPTPTTTPTTRPQHKQQHNPAPTGFNLVCKKCSPQIYKGGGGFWVGPKLGGWVLSKIPPPPLTNEAWWVVGRGPKRPGSLGISLIRTHTRARLGGWGVGAGHCFNFHFGRGGGLTPGPLDPLPPSPIALNHVRIRVLGTYFHFANFFLARLRCTYSRVLGSFHSYGTVQCICVCLGRGALMVVCVCVCVCV